MPQRCRLARHGTGSRAQRQRGAYELRQWAFYAFGWDVQAPLDPAAVAPLTSAVRAGLSPREVADAVVAGLWADPAPEPVAAAWRDQVHGEITEALRALALTHAAC